MKNCKETEDKFWLLIFYKLTSSTGQLVLSQLYNLGYYSKPIWISHSLILKSERDLENFKIVSTLEKIIFCLKKKRKFRDFNVEQLVAEIAGSRNGFGPDDITGFLIFG